MEMDCRGNSLYYARCKKYHNPLLYIGKKKVIFYYIRVSNMKNRIEEEYNRREVKPIRLNKYISDAGICSRREADRLIEAGKVKIDGVTASCGMKVQPGQTVTVGKKVIKGKNAMVVLAVNKPAGVVCTEDMRTKNNIIRSLQKRGCDVTVYPADTTAEEILGDDPDGIMLSNGPGDPKECVEIIKEIKKLYDSEVPIFAICLGHQLMALATGADTEKMRWGHRGGNHPVKDLKSGRVYISSQNHGYVIKEETIDPDVAEVSFINVNDKTIEGLDYKNKNIRTVQFHPEACPGPQDTNYLFDEFMDRMKGAKNA